MLLMRFLLYFKKHIISAKILCAFIAVIMLSVFYTCRYLETAELSGESINVFEPAVYLLSNTDFAAILFSFTTIFALCDSPQADSILPYYVLRTGRKKWWLYNIMFICCICFIIPLAVTLCSLLLSAKNGFFSSALWSRCVLLEEVGAFSLSFDKVILMHTPISALLKAFFLKFLHFALIGSTLFLLNSLFKKALSVALVLIVELLSFFIKSLRLFAGLFPLYQAGLSSHMPDKYFVPVFYFSLIIAFLSCLSFFAIKKYRFELGEAK